MRYDNETTESEDDEPAEPVPKKIRKTRKTRKTAPDPTLKDNDVQVPLILDNNGNGDNE